MYVVGGGGYIVCCGGVFGVCWGDKGFGYCMDSVLVWYISVVCIEYSGGGECGFIVGFVELDFVIYYMCVVGMFLDVFGKVVDVVVFFVLVIRDWIGVGINVWRL